MSLTIGRLAKKTGVTIETIRYYQRQGLISEPVKPVRGYRQYSEATAERIRFIKRAQQMGFTLKEIKELLSLETDHCEDIRKIAEQKLAQIDRQINDLLKLRAVLDERVNACQTDQQKNTCSMIEALNKQS